MDKRSANGDSGEERFTEVVTEGGWAGGRAGHHCSTSAQIGVGGEIQARRPTRDGQLSRDR
jgi:hypothetical protein